MTRKMVIGAVAAAMATANADVIYTWSGGDTTGGPAAAKEFASAGNWEGGVYPNAADAKVNVTSSGLGGYLTLDAAPVRLRSLTGTNTVIFGSQTMTMARYGSSEPYLGSVRVCTPVNVESGVLVCQYGSWICDDLNVASAASVRAEKGGALAFHDDFWVLPSSTVIRKIPTAVEYYGQFEFYSPCAAAGSWNFTLTEGSRFATGAAGAAVYSKCSAGQSVAGAGIAEGTYVKRILSSTQLELSQPATVSGTGVALTFGAQTVNCTRQFGVLGHNGANDHYTSISINRRSEYENYSVEVDTLNIYPASGNNRKVTIKTNSGYIPGKLVVHGVRAPASGQKNYLVLENSLVQFAEPLSGSASPGLPQTQVEVVANRTATLCVTGAMSAVITEVNPLNGTLVKTGTGTLTAGTASGAVLAGAVIVKEGVFGFADDAEASGPISLGTLTVKSGASFSVPVQGVIPTSCSFESGSAIVGRGVLHLAKFKDLGGVTVGPDVTIAFDDETLRAVTAVPAATVPGNPAFWVDCSQTNKMTLVDLGNSKTGVYRIDDVRKTSDDDAYLFSTNCAGRSSQTHIPLLKYDEDKNLNHVFFAGATSNPEQKIELTDAHAWSRPIADIRVVFEVYGGEDVTYASAPFLGATSSERIQSAVPAGETFAGVNVWSRYAKNQTLFSWASSVMKNNSQLTVNGDITNMTFKLPHASQVVGGVAPHFYPAVVELALKSSTLCHVADSYTFCKQYSTQECVYKENKHLCELIVYTNELSEAETMSVRRYLMRKWLGKDASCSVRELNADRIASASGGIAVPAGASCYVESLALDGTFRSSGAGTVFVEDGYAPGAAVKAESGTLKVRSFSLGLSEDDMVWAHFDASRIDSDHFTYAEDPQRGVKTVTAWKDLKPGSGEKFDATLWKGSSTNLPFIAENRLNGLPVLDFGPFYRCAADSPDVEANASALALPSARGHRTVVAVWGSGNGGGSLLGEPDSGWGGGYGLARGGSAGGDCGDAILRNEEHLTLGTASSYECRTNGVAANPQTAGLSGGFDVVSFTSWIRFGAGALQVVKESGGSYVDMGGGQFGEMLVCDVGLSSSRLAEIEAYLGKKWFGRDVEGYREASFASLSVASGATLEVTGGGPLSVGALSLAGGTVRGTVMLRDSADLEIVVNPDGSVSPVAVDGTIDLSRGGCIRFVGAVENLALGQHVLLAGVGSATIGDWTIDTSSLQNRRLDVSLTVSNGNVVIGVYPLGTIIYVM